MRQFRSHTVVAIALAISFLNACRDATSPATSLVDIEPLPAEVAKSVLTVDVSTAPSYSVPLAPAIAASIVGSDGFGVEIDGIDRSEVGRFVPGSVRISFLVRVRNRLQSTRLVTPTFPAPPDGRTGIYLFAARAVAIDRPGGVSASGNAVFVTMPNVGRVTPSIDWDGSPYDYIRSAPCAGSTTCARWESFDAPLASGAATAWRRVGFDVDPTVRHVRMWLLLAADLTNEH